MNEQENLAWVIEKQDEVFEKMDNDGMMKFVSGHRDEQREILLGILVTLSEYESDLTLVTNKVKHNINNIIKNLNA